MWQVLKSQAQALLFTWSTSSDYGVLYLVGGKK